jgi:hypothetical protein
MTRQAKNHTVTYKLYQQGEVVATYQSRNASIAEAKILTAQARDENLVHVVVCVVSGTYTSCQQIWPTKSAIFAK